MKKYLSYNNDNFGYIGEGTGFKNLHVGDIVFWKGNCTNGKGVVVKFNECYSIFGWCSENIKTTKNLEICGRIFDYTMLTQQLIDLVGYNELKIKEEKEPIKKQPYC